MLSQSSSCGISLIILLCWLSINDAVPYGPYPAGQVRPMAPAQSQVSDSARKKSPITETGSDIPRAVADFVRKPINANRQNSNFNSNVNVNYVHVRPPKPAGSSRKIHRKPAKNKRKIGSESHGGEQSRSNNTEIPEQSSSEPEVKKIAVEMEETTEKCVNEARRQNQTYTRSFPANVSSIDLAEEFKIAGDAEAKKSSSVHVGEDIALCWIETTTIKEDSSFEPPKRLVIREFTISFENSATIPDNYLECDKLEGEIAPGDAASIGETSLNEMIEENTKRSRVVNFTSVHRIGSIIVTQHKKVRCGVGAVVSKDIYEWPDATDNPKKRVEIKVGPSIRDLGAGSHEESAECTTDDVPKNLKADQNSSASSDCTFGECKIATACKEGEDCKEANTSSVCNGEDCSTGSLPETTYPPDSNDLLSTGVTRRTATQVPEGALADNDDSATPSPHKPDQAKGDSCVDGDTACLTGKTADAAETVTDGPKQGEDGLEEILTDGSSESCQESSEDCSCSGDSCSIHSSDETNPLEIGSKRADVSTVPSEKVPSETLREVTAKSSEATPAPLKDSECEFGECSSPSGVSSDAATETHTVPGKDVSGIEEPTGNDDESVTLKNFDITTEQIGRTELAESVRTTEAPESSKVPSNTESIPFCDDAGSEDCVTTLPGHNLSDEDRDVTIKEKSETSRPQINENEPSISCDGNIDENCRPTDSSRFTYSNTESDHGVTIPSVTEFDEGLNSATPEAPEGVTKRGFNDMASIPTVPDGGTSIIEPTSGLPESRNSSRLEEESTQCSPGSEFGDCSDATTSSSFGEGKTTLPLNQEKPNSSPRNILGSTGANNDASTNSTTTSKKSDQSSCDESTESCESSASDNGSEACEAGSTGSNCTSKGDSPSGESCDAVSGSCSSELTNQVAVNANPAITTTEATANELEKSSTTIDNVTATAETRRSTVPNSFLTPMPRKGRRRLALRIKVLLEHINENKEKEKLVQVEKQLLLNENPDENGNRSLLWQIKSLNDTMNVETLKAIFNCSAFEEIAEGVNNITEFGERREGSSSQGRKVLDSSLVEAEDENSNTRDSTGESSQRKKREIPIPQLDVVKRKNLTEAKATAIRESLPGVEEDFKKGLDHVMSRISKGLDAPESGAVGKVAESSSSSILKLLASPGDTRIHSRRRRGANEVGGVTFVEESKNPAKGEEIDRWSNERLVSAADGGKVRTVTEFKLVRDAVEDSRRLPLSS